MGGFARPEDSFFKDGGLELLPWSGVLVAAFPLADCGCRFVRLRTPPLKT